MAKTERGGERRFWAAVIACLLIGIPALWFAFGLWGFEIAVWLKPSMKSELPGRGELGDTFGAINALFSGLAFGGVVVAILLQRRELQLQREELEATRDELRGQKEQLAAQNATLRRQNFETTFFQMLSLHLGGINSERLPHQQRIREGREIFDVIWGRLREKIDKEFRGTGNAAEEIRGIYDVFYRENQHVIGHYFRRLYNLIKFVDSSAIEGNEKKVFTNFVRANLSRDELVLLFYNCIGSPGKGFKPLVERYALLKHVDRTLLRPDGIISFYSERTFN